MLRTKNSVTPVLPAIALLVLWSAVLGSLPALGAPVPLFDGHSLTGWEGNTTEVWRVRDGAIVGGSMAGNPQNEFLAATRPFTDFVLRLEYKLEGTEGFVNGGVQFRSKRISKPPNEMSGFQADIGAGYSGCLYDESRRNRMLAKADPALVQRLEKKGDWNTYEIRAEGRAIRLTLNGETTVRYEETEPNIEAEGLIALQIHGKCKAEISFRNITIDALGSTAATAPALPAAAAAAPAPPKYQVPSEAEILNRFGSGKPTEVPSPFEAGRFLLGKDEVLVFAGQENLVREQRAGELEALLASGFRELAPRFRSMAWEADTVYEQWRDMNFGAWERQLEAASATVVVAQFGQMEALDGVARLPEFTAAYHKLLDQFARRTRRLVLLSPTPFEKPEASHAPDLTLRNTDVAAYTAAIRAIAKQRGAVFVDLFSAFQQRPKSSPRLTADGIHLTANGLREVAAAVARALAAPAAADRDLSGLRQAIVEKNRVWFDCWRPANWSFVYGDRVSQAYGKGAGGVPSLRETFEAHRPLLEEADARIHTIARGANPPAQDAKHLQAPTTAPEKQLSPEEQLATFTLAEGYEVNLFASERDGVVKPTQFAWDERGRLFVACSPTYPQTSGLTKPSDYILMLEDTEGRGRATKATRFAEGLTMVQGVEPGADGLYVCDFDQLVHLRDTDGDGKADSRQVIFSGFGIGDTHQLINSITHGPDGSLWFTQGLHAFSRVESPWGIARLDRAGVWRLRPRSMRLDGFFGGGMAGANCWGVAFDDFAQVFHKSGDRPHGYWTVPGMVRGASPFGSSSPLSADSAYARSAEQYHSVGPLFDTSPKTNALDIIGTRAMPDEIQGCALIGGYFGAVVELHRFEDSGSGFKTTQLPKLMRSSDRSFRPVDVSVGPDGALYLADWFNPVIGHYQASYADPKRDKTSGRIWRITAKGRSPVKQPGLASMPARELLEQLRSPERWTRYQAKRLLFDKPDAEVLAAADAWVAALSAQTPDYERLLLEVSGVFEAHEAVRPALLAKLCAAQDPRVRAYGARVTGAWAEQLPEALQSLKALARDAHPRVRLEAVVAASYLPRPESVRVVTLALESARDPFLDYAMRQSARALQKHWGPVLASSGNLLADGPEQQAYLQKIAGAAPAAVAPGLTVYEAACLACHQPGGKGLPGVYPPLAGSDRVKGDPTRLIKILLHGLSGPVRVAGQLYGAENAVPMPGMAGLSNEQIADVLSYVRAEFGGGAPAISADQVRAVRSATATRDKPWTAGELETP